MTKTFFVMGHNGGAWEQVSEGFTTRSDAAWYRKTLGGKYRWLKIVEHTSTC